MNNEIERLKKVTRFNSVTSDEYRVLISMFPWIDSVKEGIYCLKNEIHSIPLCTYENCNKQCIFKNIGSKGYTKGCCRSHNTKLTNLEKYGCENVKQAQIFKDKASNTYHSKTDAEKQDIQRKKEESMLKKYGVTNPSYAQSVKDKISIKNKKNSKTRMQKLKENNQIKYGVDNVFQLENIKEKSKETLVKKYGVENISQSEKIKKQKEETCFEHYGVYSQNQVPDIHEKQQKYRWKDYTMPSGKVVKIQGFEHFALDLLLKTYNENDLIIERNQIPEIWYNKPGSIKKHRYMTDIFIPQENKMIEVKSPYTFEKYKSINLLKREASIEAGYIFEFMIFNNNGDLIG